LIGLQSTNFDFNLYDACRPESIHNGYARDVSVEQGTQRDHENMWETERHIEVQDRGNALLRYDWEPEWREHITAWVPFQQAPEYQNHIKIVPLQQETGDQVQLDHVQQNLRDTSNLPVSEPAKVPSLLGRLRRRITRSLSPKSSPNLTTPVLEEAIAMNPNTKARVTSNKVIKKPQSVPAAKCAAPGCDKIFSTAQALK
jgi:hypothetical protein